MLFNIFLFAILDPNLAHHSFKDEEFFQDALVSNGSSIVNNMKNLSCNIALTGAVDETHPIHYYRIQLTREMKELYPAYLTATTCCKFTTDSTIEQLYHPTFTYAFEKWNYTNNTKDEEIEFMYEDWCDYCGCNRSRDDHHHLHNTSVTLEDIPFFVGYGCGHVTECNDESLDTMLYLLSEKKGVISLLSAEDDMSPSICVNGEKSLIDISSFDDGEYIVAVGGFGDELGVYQIDLECMQFYRPIINEQINPNRSEIDDPRHRLQCDSQLTNQANSLKQLVSYYTFEITKTSRYPINITVCGENERGNTFKNIVYLVQQNTIDNVNWEYTIVDMSSDAVYYYSDLCGEHDASGIHIKLTNGYESGVYIVMVQNYFVNDVSSNFSIAVYCEPEEKELFSTIWIVCGAFVLFVATGVIIYGWIQVHFFRKQSEMFKQFLTNYELAQYVDVLQPHVSLLKELRHLNNAELVDISQMCELGEEATKKFIDACNSYRNGAYHMHTTTTDDAPIDGDLNTTTPQSTNTVKKMQFIALNTMDTDEEDAKVEEDIKEDWGSFPPTATARSLTVRSQGRIGADETHTNLRVVEGEDRIERVVSHVLSCCEDYDGNALDVYQVLAVRCVDDHSHEPDVGYPLKKCLCLRCPRKVRYWRCMKLSPFHRSICAAFIVFMLQTFGVTVTLVALIVGRDQSDDVSLCSMAEGHWTSLRILFYKFLAFFWSLYISFSIACKMRNINHNGLYKIFSVLDFEELDRIKCADFVLVRWGQMVNYYTACLAVFGSIFIIYNTSLDPDDLVSGQAGIDMILNSLALFFVLEIDNGLVYASDYEDVERIWIGFEEKYKKEKNDINRKSQRIRTHRCPSVYACCKACCQTQQFAEIFSNFVTVFMYVIGSIAPFLVFFCW